jgi:hypothetical protein
LTRSAKTVVLEGMTELRVEETVLGGFSGFGWVEHTGFALSENAERFGFFFGAVNVQAFAFHGIHARDAGTPSSTHSLICVLDGVLERNGLKKESVSRETSVESSRNGVCKINGSPGKS